MTPAPPASPPPRRAIGDPIDPLVVAARAWGPLPVHTTVRDLPGADLIAVGQDEAVAVSIDQPPRRPDPTEPAAPWTAWVWSWRLNGDWPHHRERQVPPYTTVESIALAHGTMPTQAFYLPGLLWRPGPLRRRPLAPLVVDGDTTLNLVAALARLPRIPRPRDAAIARVAEIRALYGRMLADIAYRIENSALFDTTVTPTRQFETALALWSDVTARTSDEEIIHRASAVAVAFDTARAHAETIGLLHLPHTARDSARRAAGAARLANSTNSEAEQAAAHGQVVSILSGLRISYLPDPATMPRAITAPPANGSPDAAEGALDRQPLS